MKSRAGRAERVLWTSSDEAHNEGGLNEFLSFFSPRPAQGILWVSGTGFRGIVVSVGGEQQ